MTGGPITVVGVVVPAHDEQQLLPACLASVRVAARHPALRHVQVRLVPVLDTCSDDSGELAPDALEVRARNVGVARAAGFAAVLRAEAGRPAHELWLAARTPTRSCPRLAGRAAAPGRARGRGGRRHGPGP